LFISLVLFLVKINFFACVKCRYATGAREWSLVNVINPAFSVAIPVARGAALRYAFYHLERAEDGDWKESIQGPVVSFFRG